MKDEIKIRITKVARRTCGDYLDHGTCLLATSLNRKNRFGHVYVGYDNARIDGVLYWCSGTQANRIRDAYDKPTQAFKPFNVTLRRDNVYA